ncbi:MAG TPA: hypothetical protein VIW80_11570 [Pyrinomonadaceae bacterium]|jgi:hypothetical protein
MKLRPFITLLLTITLTINATAQAARNGTDDTPADKDDEKITAQEEREARELVAQLTTRWQETEDIGPLVEEFYVSDFAERLRHEPQLLYFAELKEELLTPETPPELKRHYVAMTNFLHLIFRLYTVYESMRTKDDEQELDLKRIIPANILNVFESNPNLKALMDEEAGDQAEGRTGPQAQEAQEQASEKGIKNIEQLRLLTNALEQAVVLLREHVKTLPATLSAREIVRAGRSEEDAGAAEEDDPLKPRSYTLTEEFYGYPAGTRLICVDLLPLHADLVRVGQRLKVVSIYMQSD